jgi:lipopolysaccharide transport system ATP-binding protein
VSGPLISVEGVTKFYPRVHRPWERLRAFAALVAGNEPQGGAEVLHDVSLEVREGESFGIIGENGAGKSTLLKVLTGVITPSRGQVSVNGRVAALLELGAGFQPEFSGIDNVKMKASLLGMSARQLDKSMDDILSFADIGEYVHEPVKHYSSGMVVRLGFAVIAASDPKILITDEVLAVGDESFQKKCINWIESFLKEGNTLLMVSHSMYMVQKLCQRALWLHEGRNMALGEVFEVTQSYLAWHEIRSAEEKRGRESVQGQASFYRIEKFQLENADQEGDLEIRQGEDVQADLILFSPDGRAPAGMIGILRADGTPVYGVATDYDDAQATRLDEHTFRYRIRFSSPALLPGSYSIRGHAMDPEGIRLCDTAEQRLRVQGESRELGFIRLPHEWV